VLEEGRVQADLEEWILKLEEIKRDIEARERLYSEFVREKKSWNHAHQKVPRHPPATNPHARVTHLAIVGILGIPALSSVFVPISGCRRHRRSTSA
jgi:hypothetical protein